MAKQSRYPLEVRERAVRLLLENTVRKLPRMRHTC